MHVLLPFFQYILTLFSVHSWFSCMSKIRCFIIIKNFYIADFYLSISYNSKLYIKHTINYFLKSILIRSFNARVLINIYDSFFVLYIFTYVCVIYILLSSPEKVAIVSFVPNIISQLYSHFLILSGFFLAVIKYYLMFRFILCKNKRIIQKFNLCDEFSSSKDIFFVI